MNEFPKQQSPESPERKELTAVIQGYSEKMKNFEFFENLKKQHLSMEDYSRYFSHKYSTVGYFTDFLQDGANIAKEGNLPHIQESFQSNYNDESGIMDSVYDKDWEHETWRQTMLKHLDVKSTSENPEYSKMIQDLKSNKNIFFMSGYLTLVELFVAMEMKNIWNGMKRDLPAELTDYDKEKIPHNPLEYIQNHADHDGKHYAEIMDAVLKDMKSEEEKQEFLKGLDFGYMTRQKLYERLNEVTFTKIQND